jgi:hypothetical protein
MVPCGHNILFTGVINTNDILFMLILVIKSFLLLTFHEVAIPQYGDWPLCVPYAL